MRSRAPYSSSVDNKFLCHLCWCLESPLPLCVPRCMEALEPEEVFAELLRIQREQQVQPQTILMTDPVDVPLLLSVLARVYGKSKTRVFTRMHAQTLTHARCYCVEPSSQCVCNRAAWFIVRCWFMQVDRGELWLVAQRLAAEYRLECSVASEKKLPFYSC